MFPLNADDVATLRSGGNLDKRRRRLGVSAHSWNEAIGGRPVSEDVHIILSAAAEQIRLDSVADTQPTFIVTDAEVQAFIVRWSKRKIIPLDINVGLVRKFIGQKRAHCGSMDYQFDIEELRALGRRRDSDHA